MSHEHEQSSLSTDVYSNIERRLAFHTDPARESAAVLLPSSTRPYKSNVYEFDRTLSRQLDDLHYDSDVITQGLTDQPPQAYLFTLSSAVPVADAFRGYFRAAGRTLPLLGTIAANRALSQDHFDQDDDPIRPPYTEVRRLEALTEDLDHVCIVDQYVGTGLTLQYAAILLEHAGVRVRTAIRGNWYHNANVDTDEIDTEKLTSKHAEFMLKAGKVAWQNAV